MKHRWVVAGLLVLMPFVVVQACGPDFYPDLFVHKLQPDRSQEFAGGKLGILWPTLTRADLMVAFRYLNGGSLSLAQRRAYHPEYSYLEWDWRSADSPRPKVVTAPDAWKAIHAKYAGPAPEIDQDRRVEVEIYGHSTYREGYLNCHDDAFRTAISTLQSRAKTWGEKSPELVDWIKGQDSVFANCAGPKLVLPQAVPPGASALLMADRAYQRAAAEFYAGNFEDARNAFEAIAQEPGSPWHGIAGYLAARCLIREAFLSRPETQYGMTATFDVALMRQAAASLTPLLTAGTPGVSKKAIRSELNLVMLRIEPMTRMRELATALAGPKPDAEFNQDLEDLRWFLNAKCEDAALREDASDDVFLTAGEQEKRAVPSPAVKAAKYGKTYVQFAPLRSSAPLVDWLLTFQSPAKEAKDHALARWEATRETYWLLASITKAMGDDAQAATLVAAAEQVQNDSPAWESLTYHRARLLIALGRMQEARDLLDQVLPQIQQAGPDSPLNAYLGLRMRASADLNEVLRYAPRKILLRNSISQDSLRECLEVMRDPRRKYDCQKEVIPTQFSDDAASFFNDEAPVSVLVDAATSSALPEQLRRSVAVMAWVRAVLLKDGAGAGKLLPFLPPNLQQQSDGGTDFRSLMTIVRNPGLRPYLDAGVQRSYSYDFVESYRDNWWCQDWQGPSFGESVTPMRREPTSFLTLAQRTDAEQQAVSLARKESAEVYLGGLVLAYAKDHPEDPDVPEALYLVLRMVRYGCNSYAWANGTLAQVQADKEDAVRNGAARLLRQRYAASPWTKKAAPFVG